MNRGPGDDRPEQVTPKDIGSDVGPRVPDAEGTAPDALPDRRGQAALAEGNPSGPDAGTVVGQPPQGPGLSRTVLALGAAALAVLAVGALVALLVRP